MELIHLCPANFMGSMILGKYNVIYWDRTNKIQLQTIFFVIATFLGGVHSIEFSPQKYLEMLKGNLSFPQRLKQERTGA